MAHKVYPKGKAGGEMKQLWWFSGGRHLTVGKVHITHDGIKTMCGKKIPHAIYEPKDFPDHMDPTYWVCKICKVEEKYA